MVWSAGRLGSVILVTYRFRQFPDMRGLIPPRGYTITMTWFKGCCTIYYFLLSEYAGIQRTACCFEASVPVRVLYLRVYLFASFATANVLQCIFDNLRLRNGFCYCQVGTPQWYLQRTASVSAIARNEIEVFTICNFSVVFSRNRTEILLEHVILLQRYFKRSPKHLIGTEMNFDERVYVTYWIFVIYWICKSPTFM